MTSVAWEVGHLEQMREAKKVGQGSKSAIRVNATCKVQDLDNKYDSTDYSSKSECVIVWQMLVDLRTQVLLKMLDNLN
jgi:hypothetical protein